MDYPELSSLLENITGHLKAATSEQEKELRKAQQRIANSLLRTEDVGGELLFANSNFYAKENIDNTRLKRIETIAKKTIETSKDDGFRTFIRTVPARTSQISGSIPNWANGAKAVETMGPFVNSEGRYAWVDVYKTVKLTTLYIGSDPILLFKSRVHLNLPTAISPNYNIVAGTVWVKAKLLSPNAPDNSFVGIKVKSGSIKLSKNPLLLILSSMSSASFGLLRFKGHRIDALNSIFFFRF